MATNNIVNIEMDQGTTYEFVWTLTNPDSSLFDLTGYTARLQVRQNYGSTQTVINATTANSMITLGGSTGTVTLNLAPTDTSSLRMVNVNDSELDCYYDLKITSPSGTVYEPANGTFIIDRAITR